jgi:Zn-dependent protease
MGNLSLETIINVLPAILIGLTFHEYMHAKVAYLLGDDTAYQQGRVSLNPIKHIDWLGFLFILIAGFGWAKPVVFNPQNLKKPRRDEMLIAVAGPLSNLLLAIISAIVMKFFVLLNGENQNILLLWFQNVLISSVLINYGLFIFNMLPIPPLDGSHLLLKSFKINPETERNIFKYGSLALLAIVIIDSQTDMNLLPIGSAIKFLAQQTFTILQIF